MVAETGARTSMKRAVSALALPIALCASACSEPDAGEVTLMVSTDLSLPSDLDWLEWSVTPLAHPELAQSSGIVLDRANALPATLAVVAGKRGAETVLVRVSGRTGGERGSLRVTREAQFQLPDHGQQLLSMPLNWLCSDVNLPEPCAEGTTCDAGHCVSSQQVSLVDHLPSPSPACFDVLGCTLTGLSIRQTPDLEDDRCLLEPKAGLGSPLNVALIVNADQAGNAGVCARASDAEGAPASAGNCFVPLAEKSGPGGWDLTTNRRKQTVIQLPRAVCEPLERTTIAGVAVTQQTGCTSRRSIDWSCAAPSVCVPASASCPSDFPSSWQGYSCSGVASPKDDPSLGLSYCGVSDADPELGATVRGHYCCTQEQAASKDPLLIDDMRGGPLIKFPVPPGQIAGSWFTASDDDKLPLSPPQAANSLFTYRPIDPVTPAGGPTITRAACFRMDRGFSGYYALEGFSFYGSGADATALDVSPYSGISFWAELTSFDPDIPQPIRVVFPNLQTDTEHPTSACLSSGLGKANCDHFGAPLPELSATWKKFTVRWTDLKQSPERNQQHFPEGFDPHVYTVDFQATGPGPDAKTLSFDFCVSQISFLP